MPTDALALAVCVVAFVCLYAAAWRAGDDAPELPPDPYAAQRRELATIERYPD